MTNESSQMPLWAIEHQGQLNLALSKLDSKIDLINLGLEHGLTTHATLIDSLHENIKEVRTAQKNLQDHMEMEVERREKALADTRRFTIGSVLIPLVCVLLAALFYWITSRTGTLSHSNTHTTGLGLFIGGRLW